MAGKTTIITVKKLPTRPANAFGENDSTPHAYFDLSRVKPSELSKRLGISAKEATALLKAHKAAPILESSQLDGVKGLSKRSTERLRTRLLLSGDTGIYISDVTVRDRFLFSNTAFELTAAFVNRSASPAAILSVTVLWNGEPFVVEKEVTKEEAERGETSLIFDEHRTLPVGQAEFLVVLYRADGAQATFRKTYWVLPSNPLSLSLSPAGATVTGTWSARGEFQPGPDRFLTQVTITIANGDANPVGMNRNVQWSFWDGPVGSGTRIESGSFNWSSGISVPAHGVWRGTAWFSSPHGSGIYDVYHRKEDMAINIEMTALDGRRISGQITCRVMLAYGVNIIKVGTFGAQEHNDLYSAVDQMRQIYERRDISLRGVQRYIINNQLAGGYTVLDSENEYRNLLSDWSVPNDYVDVFVVQQFNWGGYNGYAGDIPGPASKGGNKDGVAVDKSGFTDASGTMRLDSATLAKLIGHEVGHYLGLVHVSTSNNLMLANTGVRGPDLSYDQYRTMFPHGFMVSI